MTVFQMQIVEDSRSIPSESPWPGTTIPDIYQKNSLLPSAVKFIEWNTDAAIWSNEGSWGSKTTVR